MNSYKVASSVIPAAGIHNHLKTLDPRLRGDDNKEDISIFYEAGKIGTILNGATNVMALGLKVSL